MKAYFCAAHGLTFIPPACGLCHEIDVVEVELHSTDPPAVDAVGRTLGQLPLGGGRLMEHGGRFYVEDGFVAYACERQGYVKEVRR